ncbi:suppressor of tumorigenicity 14 protein homolog [Acyrthosiphon pisum]|uniref:Peptidase S1 domain-containing protein n=1 Tax=Acyrthosiphon pisum TaxID=7029 RepID=A0A8R2JR44_ACYPI|nr:suppressor of tumorigenicity 14 protein homolog [Acyrthosiphon pisum]
MKVMFSWLIYSCLIFESGILCDRRLERRQAVSSCSIYTEDKFYCSNGLCIEWSLVCDGIKDCTDGLDETKELCARYEYGTNMTMDCGRVNIKNQEGDMNKTAVETLPWNVQVYKFNKIKFIYFRMCDGSIIAPNVVISGGGCFGFHGEAANKISVRIGEFKVAVGKYDKNISKIGTEFSQIMNVETIYLKDNNIQLGDHIAVIVLENKFSFNNDISPICIDWNNIYNIQTGDLGKIVIWGENKVNATQSPSVLERSFPYIDPGTCQHLYRKKGFSEYETYDLFCVSCDCGNTNLDFECSIGANFGGGGLAKLPNSALATSPKPFFFFFCDGITALQGGTSPVRAVLPPVSVSFIPHKIRYMLYNIILNELCSTKKRRLYPP